MKRGQVNTCVNVLRNILEGATYKTKVTVEALIVF